jgi:hypothetical protein
LVDANNYLSELIRYVHLNPVRAGIVPKPESYLWSGHSAYLGSTDIVWLSQEWLLKKFDPHEISARKLYAEYVNKGIGKPLPQELYLGSHEGRILGDDKFIEEVLDKNQDKSAAGRQLSIHDLVNITADTLQVSVSALQSQAKRSKLAQARGIAALIVREHVQLSIKELADVLAKDPTALCRSATAVDEQSLFSEELRQAVERVRNRISLHCKDYQV